MKELDNYIHSQIELHSRQGDAFAENQDFAIGDVNFPGKDFKAGVDNLQLLSITREP